MTMPPTIPNMRGANGLSNNATQPSNAIGFAIWNN
jgi:hypothetical protein